MKKHDPDKVPPGMTVVYVTSFWHKKARKRIFAASFGLRAFRFLVRDPNPNSDNVRQ